MVDIDPQMQVILERARALNRPPQRTVTVTQSRADSVEGNKVWNEDPPEVARIEDILVDGANEKRRLRLYMKEGLDEPAPTLLYLHGGGWVLCSPDTHDALCRRLALAGGFAVASLDYGLAPEHPFPEPVEDCIAASRWVADHGLDIGLDASRMAIAGDSAGANLSLATMMGLRDRGTQLFAAGALIYGMYDDDLTTESHKAFGDGFYLTTDDILWFWEQYIPDPANRHHPLAAPIHGELHDLPPLYISAAGLDPLKNDSDKLVAKLAAAGVEFDYQVWPGVTHACLMMSRMLDRADGFIAEIADFVDRRLIDEADG